MQNLAGANNTAAHNLYIEPCTMMYGPGGYTCENLDDPQKGHVFGSNTCMCNATQNPYRLLGGAGMGEVTVPAAANNTFLFGNSSGRSYESVRFSCCTANCPTEEKEALLSVAKGSKCADGLPGTPPKTKTDCPAGVSPLAIFQLLVMSYVHKTLRH